MINLLNIASWVMAGLAVINIGIQAFNFCAGLNAYNKQPHMQDAIATRIATYHAKAMQKLCFFLAIWFLLQFMIRLWPQI